MIGSDIEPETPPTETNSPTALDQSDNAMVKMSTYGRGRPLKLIRDRQSPSLQQPSPGGMNNTNPLTITAANMTDTEISRAIEDARQANDELFIRDVYKVFKNLTSFPKTGEENNFEKTIRRSKRLTKTNPIVRYNNPICHDYRKHRRKAELGSNTESNGNGNEQP